MFYYLKGEVSEIGQNSLVLDTNGIGFFINVSLKTLSNVKVDSKVKLYISESISETNYDLFGFADLQEKRFFELLISISGVGPKAAISLLSTLSTDMLIRAIINDDSKSLTAAPGIGKKIAQRIILELRDKLGAEAASIASQSSKGVFTEQNNIPESSAVSDAIAALAVLGYNSAEIVPIIKKGDWTGMQADQIIRSVLKNMI